MKYKAKNTMTYIWRGRGHVYATFGSLDIIICAMETLPWKNDVNNIVRLAYTTSIFYQCERCRQAPGRPSGCLKYVFVGGGKEGGFGKDWLFTVAEAWDT